MFNKTDYENFWYAFGLKLDKILEERKMTYRGLSLKLGKSPGYIYDILNCRIDPSFASMCEMAAYFGCTIWDFLDVSKEMP